MDTANQMMEKVSSTGNKLSDKTMQLYSNKYNYVKLLCEALVQFRRFFHFGEFRDFQKVFPLFQKHFFLN